MLTEEVGRSEPRPPLLTSWHTSDVLRATSLVLVSLVALWVVRHAIPVLLAMFLAIVFGVALSAGVDRLAARRVPRGVGASLILLVFIGLIVGLGAWLAPTLRAQSSELRQKLPIAIDRVQHWLDQKQNGLISLVSETVPEGGAPAIGVGDSAAKAPPPSAIPAPSPRAQGSSLRDRLGRGAQQTSRFVFPVLYSTVEAAGGVLFVIFIAVYLATEPQHYRQGFLALFPAARHVEVSLVLDRVGAVLRKWLVTQGIFMAVMGAASTVTLLLLHVKAAVALGVLAGVLSFIPTIGGIASAVPAIAMGFLDSPEKAILVTVIYFAIHFIGSHVLVPILMKGGINLPPALTLFAQAILTLLFGFLGLMVAVPLLATIMAIVQVAYVEPLARRS